MMYLKDNLEIIQKKAKERTVKTQTIEYDLETLVKKIEKGLIKLSPDYQRKHRWSDEFSSRLIESLILNIPIPTIYLSQDVDVDEEVSDDISRYSVIDGQQRLTAIKDYFKGEYSLIGLDTLIELNGTFYNDLPPFLTRRLEERTIKCMRIDSTADSQVKYDIFERLNSGSITLSAQELRNATCRGKFNDLIKSLVKNRDFLEIIRVRDHPKRSEKMEDEELVLRYFAMTYKDGYKKYKGGFNKFLTENMLNYNGFAQSELNGMKRQFESTMRNIRNSFGDEPFAKYIYDKNKSGKLSWRKQSSFNTAVYDCVVCAFSKRIGDVTVEYPKFKELFKDEEFRAALEASISNVNQLSKRIEKSMEVIK